MKQKEFGDFQTPDELAREVVELVSQTLHSPDIVVEPTCGKGSFLDASYAKWGKASKYFGFEIDDKYFDFCTRRFFEIDNIIMEKQDFFSFDWNLFFKKYSSEKILLIGNPPWVTNSTQGVIGGKNLPVKSNFQGHKGFDAKTGKANFDIAEWIIIKLMESVAGFKGYLAFLCKTATARKVLIHFWKKGANIGQSKLYLIDAKKFFNVSVDACLFLVEFSGDRRDKSALVYSSMKHDKKMLYRFGMQKGQLISNLDDYGKYKYLDGFSNYTWRSGIKHDAAKVMELSLDEGRFINGFGERVDIENTFVYPLLKSSDIGNNRLIPRKYVIVTQQFVGEDTNYISELAPKTWNYLRKYSSELARRKSSIYKNRPQYSMFGVGRYSFSKWKVAVSGLYKNTLFVVVPPFDGKPTMVDDTCYFIPCGSEQEARYWAKVLNSDDNQRFLKSLIFFDSKRPVTVDILKRINMAELSRRHGEFELARDRKSTRLNSSHTDISRMPSSA